MILPYFIGVVLLAQLYRIYGDFLFLPEMPKALVRKAERIEQGKLPANVKRHLSLAAPGYMEHHHGVPGRLACHVRPCTINGDKVYTYVIGLKDTADSKPSQWIKVPIYKNGNIYGA